MSPFERIPAYSVSPSYGGEVTAKPTLKLAGMQRAGIRRLPVRLISPQGQE